MFVPNLLETSQVCFARVALTWDLEFPLRLISGLEAVAVGCRTRVMMCRGEWFLDLSVGIPYLPTSDGAVPENQAILGGKFNHVAIRQAFLQELMSVPGVVDVPTLRVSFDGATRNLEVIWVARAQFGGVVEDTLTRTI